MPYIYDEILSETTEEHALEWARGMVWQEVEGRHTSMPKHWRRIETFDGIGVYYDYGADYYFFVDEWRERDDD